MFDPFFSITIATRNRPESLIRLIDSLKRTTNNIDRCEFIFGIDTDDTVSLNAITSCCTELNYKIVIRLQGLSLANDYWNMLIKLTVGEFIWCLCDDCEIMTNHWDDMVLLTPFGSIAMLDVYDTGRFVNGKLPEGVCGFPIITRAAYDKLGYHFNPADYREDADTILYRTYKEANKIIQMQGLVVKHHWITNDDTYRHIDQFRGNPWRDVSRESAKLK